MRVFNLVQDFKDSFLKYLSSPIKNLKLFFCHKIESITEKKGKLKNLEDFSANNELF